MLVRCPTCHGLGTINQAFPEGTVMGYCGPNGERWPQETCQSCGGSGWCEDGSSVHRAPVAPTEEKKDA